MRDSIINSFDTWTTAQGRKSKGRVKSISNISLEGIVRLRELILELAVRGKLVPQNPEDESASVLLEKIAKEKEILIKDGKIKKQKLLPAIADDEKPYELPDNWRWIRLSDCYDVRDGTHDSPKAQSSGIPLVTSKNLYTGRLDLSNVNYISQEDHLKIIARSKVDKGDILFAMIGSIGNPVIVDTEEVFSIKNVALFKYYSDNLSSPDYLRTFLEVAAIEMKEKASGGVQSFVSLGKLRTHMMPLPPLREQHRIVTKVDELMALCDQLEQQETNHLKSHQLLVETLLGTLTQAADTDEMQSAWHRMSQHFDDLFTTEDSIDQLKQTVLQLAVMGKLVSQNPNDEPASKLLEKISDEKQKLIKEGKIKKQKPLPEITEEEKPFELPEGWEWCRLGTFTTIKGGKRLPKSEVLQKEPTDHVYIRVTDMKNNTIDDSDLHYISDYVYEKIKQYIIEKNDIYLTIVGATIGKLGLVPERFHGMNLTENAARIIMYKVDEVFLSLFMNSEFIQNQFFDKTQHVGVPKLALHRVSSSMFPLPPLSEQHRIVAKVDELFALCDQLKARITHAQEIKNLLANAVVEGAVSK